MLTLNATTSEEYTLTLNSYPRILVDYYKDHCPGCKMLELALTRFAATSVANGIVVLKVKLEIFGDDFFRHLGLRQTPTLALFKDGHETQRLSGYQTPAQIEQAVVLGFG